MFTLLRFNHTDFTFFFLCQEVKEEVWYHEGDPELKIARLWMAKYSLPRASERLKQMRIKQARPDPEKAAKTQELHRKLRGLNNFCSQLVMIDHCLTASSLQTHPC